jgi:hypothetical protein
MNIRDIRVKLTVSWPKEEFESLSVKAREGFLRLILTC